MAVKRFRVRKIKEIMGPPSEYTQYTVDEKANIQDAAKLLENRYHMVVVVDGNNIPVGLLTQTDLVKKISSGSDLRPSIVVKDVMNMDFMRISEETTIDAAISLMNSAKINKLVVVNVDGTYKGVLHKSDVARAVQKLL